MQKNSAYYKLSRPEMLKFLPNSLSTMLEVGCSSGNFSRAAKRTYGCRIVGIEPHGDSAAIAAKHLDQVHCMGVEVAISQITDRFDAIVFNDVLEHLVDPEAVLIKCHKLLSISGVIVASIPNVMHYHELLQFLINKDWKYTEAGVMDRTHLRFFTKKSIKRMFDECGYKIKTIEGLDPTPSKKMSLIAALSFGYYSEMRYPQFAVVAAPR